MSMEMNSFRFREFELVSRERVLLRDGKPVAITPKAFQLLLVLVENRGHLVEKSELMRAVWEDSFVEEGNLSYTMLLLRKTLGDEKNDPRFIQTVPKRGYRFIAEVEAVSNGTGSESVEDPKTAATADQTASFTSTFRRRGILALGILILCVSGLWYFNNLKGSPIPPVLAAPFASVKISTTGNVHHAVISPDGKNVVYSFRTANNQEGIWLRELESLNNVELISASGDAYGGLKISSQGNFLYFSRKARTEKSGFDIFRVSIFGGVPTKLISNVEGWFSLSSDDSAISFVRCKYENSDYCSLWIAESGEGRKERMIVSRPYPFRIGDNAISPDGRSVAFAVGQSKNRANEFNLAEVDLESGNERLLTPEKFFNIKGLVWFADQSGLLITASRHPAIGNYLIRQVVASTGEVRTLSKDAEDYATLSLDKSGTTLVSTYVKEDKFLYSLDLENPSNLQKLSGASTAAFASNDSIVFYSVLSGDREIWSIDEDGSNLRQLTNNTAEDADPIVSPESGSILFVSNRTGESHVWQMNADGSNQRQITKKEGGTPHFVTPDGKWIYFTHGVQRNLWRVPANGGKEELVLDTRLSNVALSPDGSQAAIVGNDEKIIKIVSLVDWKTVKTLEMTNGVVNPYGLTWSPDGKDIAYAFVENSTGKSSVRLQALNENNPRQIFETGDEIYSISFAPDRKHLAIVQGRWKHDAVILKGLN